MRKRVVVILLVLVGGACALLFDAFYRDAKRSAVTRLNEEQRIHARQAARSIEDFFTTWTDTLAALGKLDEIVDVDVRGRAAITLFYEAHHEQIRSITRMDERGVILFTYPFSAAEGTSLTDQAHVREIIRDHRPVVSEVFTAVQGFEAVALHVPVFKGPAFRGSIAAVIDFENLARRYLDVLRIGATGNAWVVGRDATLIYSPTPGLAGVSALKRFSASPSATALVEAMIRGREGSATYEVGGRDGPADVPTRNYAVYVPVHLGNTFWSVAVASAESELFASLNSYRNRLALVIGLAYIGGIFFSLVAAKAWLIVREDDRRRQFEKTLRESEERFRTLFASSPDGIILTDPVTLEIVDCNTAAGAMNGYTREEMLGRSVAVLHPTEIAAGFEGSAEGRRSFVRELSERGVLTIESVHRRKDGSEFPLETSMTLITIGGQVLVMGIDRDISDRKRIEAEVQRHWLYLEDLVAARTADLAAARDRAEAADRLKSAFLATMSHELRTPLNSIIGFTGILLQGLPGPLNPEQIKQLGMVRESARHLLELINDVLDISKIEAGQLKVAHTAFDLRGAIDKVTRSVAPLAQRKNLSLAVRIDPGIGEVVLDARRVEQVLLNLLSNAIKFTETGGITVSADLGGAPAGPSPGGLPALPGRTVRVTVEDTGIGMEAEDLAQLFRPFHQIDHGLTRQRDGTGLGLAISRKLAKLLGGDITVESRRGAGSRFVFTFPVGTEEYHEAESPPH